MEDPKIDKELEDAIAESDAISPIRLHDDIFKDILDERCRQIEKWGFQNVSLPEWMTILGEEFGESCQEALRCHFGFDGAPGEHMGDSRVVRFRREMVQLATVAFAILEFVDREHPNVRGMDNE